MTSEHGPSIVLVEDDHFQREDHVRSLESILPGARVEVISCESEFLDRYEKKPAKLPDLFIIDMMLEWNCPSIQSKRKLPSPVPFQDEAGVRCFDVIRSYSKTVPIILWTVTNAEFPRNKAEGGRTLFFRKDRMLEVEILDQIRKLNLV